MRQRTMTLAQIAVYLGVGYDRVKDYYLQDWVNNAAFPDKEAYPKKPFRFNRLKVMAFFRNERKRQSNKGK